MAEILQFRVDVRGRYLSQDLVNTFMYYAFLEGDEDDRGPATAALVSAFVNRFADAYSDLSVAAATYTQVIGYYLNVNVLQRFTYTQDVNWQSAVAAEGVPPAVAAIIKRRGELTGSRAFRGRIFVGGVRMLDVPGGIINPASHTAAALDVLAARIKEVLTVRPGLPTQVNFVPALIQFRRPALASGLYRQSRCGSTFVRPQLGTQRHRSPGHGRAG